jgi:hypothetical protein
MNGKEISHQLMMASLDGEASPEQELQLQTLLQADPALRQEFEELRSLKELTMSNKPEEPLPSVWESYWTGVYARVERGLGWVLFSLGAIVLTLFGAWEFAKEWISDSSIPLWVRLAGVSLAAGTIILLISVIREKLFLHKHERYKDIQR